MTDTLSNETADKAPPQTPRQRSAARMADAAGGSVRLEARLTGGGLNILVRDTGAGFRPGDSPLKDGAGVGLKNVARRLELAYGPSAGLHIESAPGATEVSFTIPVAQAAEAAR